MSMKMIDNRYNISSHTFSEMENYMYELKRVYAQACAAHILKNDCEHGTYRFAELSDPFVTDSLETVYDNAMSDLLELIRGYNTLMLCIKNGTEFNYID